jgi:hypothetical protein
MISSFQALGVFVLALLPGASYTFAYEREVGSFGVRLSDRLVRFVAASAVFQALLAGPAIIVYRQYVVTGRLQRGEIGGWLVEGIAVAYVLLPSAIGYLVGSGQRRDGWCWNWTRLLAADAPEPLAWDHLWRRSPNAIVRVKLKSGSWVAGAYGTVKGRRAYAAAYPEPSDIYLSAAIQVDPATGEFQRHTDGTPRLVDGGGGLLIRWEEAEYFEVLET